MWPRPMRGDGGAQGGEEEPERGQNEVKLSATQEKIGFRGERQSASAWTAMAAEPLFDEFLILSVPLSPDGVAPAPADAVPTVSWRLSDVLKRSAAGAARVAAQSAPEHSDAEITQFCFPYVPSQELVTGPSPPSVAWAF